MKVGILTHHWLPNFGANLQALATVETLRGMGHDPVILDYRIPDLKVISEKTVSAEQREHHERFVSDYLPLSAEFNEARDIVDVSSDLDAVFSGSDAVLRLYRSLSHREDMVFPNAFWLQWTREAGIKKTGFLAASSMGSNFLEHPRETRKGISEAVENLTHCGIRDSWTQQMLALCGVEKEKIHYCPDPVSTISNGALLDKLPQVSPPEKPFILMSFYKRSASPSWINSLAQELKKRGFLTVGLPQPDTPSDGPFDMNLSLPMSPLEWLAWFQASSGYIGVRFHPIVISQSLQKPFVAFDHYDVGIPFHNKVLRKAGRAMAPFSRSVSKTYDLSKRMGKAQYVIPSRSWKSYTPQRVAEMIIKQQAEGDFVQDVLDARCQQFQNTITAVLD